MQSNSPDVTGMESLLSLQDEDSLERIKIMCRQEDDVYRVQRIDSPPFTYRDMRSDSKNTTSNSDTAVFRHDPVTQNDTKHGLSKLENMKNKKGNVTNFPISPTSTMETRTNNNEERIGKNCNSIQNCRTKMILWCYELVKFCNMNVETVELTISCLDRFLFQPSNKPMSHHSEIDDSDTKVHCSTVSDDVVCWNPKFYQLICMTSFYTCVKIHEPIAFNPDIVSRKLSRNAYSTYQIEQTELLILSKLQYYVNPPTIYAFVREYLLLIKPYIMKLDGNDNLKQLYNVNGPHYRNFFDVIDEQIKYVMLNYENITTHAYTKAFNVFLSAICYTYSNTQSEDLQNQCIHDIGNLIQNAIHSTGNKFSSSSLSNSIVNTIDYVSIHHFMEGTSPHMETLNISRLYVRDNLLLPSSLSSPSSVTQRTPPSSPYQKFSQRMAPTYPSRGNDNDCNDSIIQERSGSDAFKTVSRHITLHDGKDDLTCHEQEELMSSLEQQETPSMILIEDKVHDRIISNDPNSIFSNSAAPGTTTIHL